MTRRLRRSISDVSAKGRLFLYVKYGNIDNEDESGHFQAEKLNIITSRKHH